MDNACPHCGSVQPQNRLICAVCGGELDEPVEKATTLPPPRAPEYSRRRLIIGVMVGGVGLACLGSCVGAALLSKREFRRTSFAPAPVPVDTHRVLNLPLGEFTVTDFTWLPDTTQLLVVRLGRLT
jgi:hypothetical protein